MPHQPDDGRLAYVSKNAVLNSFNGEARLLTRTFWVSPDDTHAQRNAKATSNLTSLFLLVFCGTVDLHAGAVSTSLRTLLARIEILRRFLEETKNGEDPRLLFWAVILAVGECCNDRLGSTKVFCARGSEGLET